MERESAREKQCVCVLCVVCVCACVCVVSGVCVRACLGATDEEGRSKGRAPDGAAIWISEPKNAVERLPAGAPPYSESHSIFNSNKQYISSESPKQPLIPNPQTLSPSPLKPPKP